MEAEGPADVLQGSMRRTGADVDDFRRISIRLSRFNLAEGRRRRRLAGDDAAHERRRTR